MPVLHPRPASPARRFPVARLAARLALGGVVLAGLSSARAAAQETARATAREAGQESAPAPGAAPPGAASPAEAADEPGLPYETTLRPTGNAALDDALGGISALRRLQRSAPTTAEGLVARALGEREQLRRALRSEGFYEGTAVVLLDGAPPETPNLAARLAARPAGGPPVPVTIGAESGPRFTIGALRVAPSTPGTDITDAGDVSGLAPGDPARAQSVIDAGERLLTGMREAGHPFASVVRRDAVVDRDTDTMDVTYVLEPGPRARFALPNVQGATRVDPALLRAVAGQLDDRPYDPRQLDRVRRDILQLGVFGTVRARTAEELDGDGRLPTTFLVAERERRAVGITGAYETRNGPTVRTYWEHRNLFGAAERLRLEAEVGRTQQAGGDTGLSARVSANLRSPWILGRNLTLVQEIAALRERLLAYDRDAVTANVSVESKPDPRLTLSGGVLGEYGTVLERGEGKRNVRLAGLLGTALWDGADNLLDPTRGVRGNALLSPIYSFGGFEGPFVRLRLGGSAYWDVRGDKGTVLATRALVGSIVGAGGVFDVPPQYRFYAGGGGSVRGYDYQRVGPQRTDRTPTGGLAVVEGSLELRQRVYESWGMAAFVDAGSINTDEYPDFGNLAVGVGLGVRYATVIGPIRADVALPLTTIPGNSGYGLYVGIGQAF